MSRWIGIARHYVMDDLQWQDLAVQEGSIELETFINSHEPAVMLNQLAWNGMRRKLDNISVAMLMEQKNAKRKKKAKRR